LPGDREGCRLEQEGPEAVQDDARGVETPPARLGEEDEIDQASSEYQQSMIFRLRDREKFLLAKIDKAVGRIDAGTFGICERCEEEISPKRLEARPVTTLCIRCKEEQEQAEKSFG
jgi:RNA polymerase-binding protein DksA